MWLSLWLVLFTVLIARVDLSSMDACGMYPKSHHHTYDHLDFFSHFVYLCICLFETSSCHVALASLELTM